MRVREHLPFYMLSKNEKREVVRPAFPDVRGATVRLDNPLGFQVGLLVLAHRVGFTPLPGDVIRFARAEEAPHSNEAGWWIALEPWRSPNNSREEFFTEPWAAERTDSAEGLLRILDPSMRPGGSATGKPR